MEKGKVCSLALKVLVAFCAIVFAGGAAFAQESSRPALTVDDCAKCHEREPREIEAKGAAHKTQIDCQSCHERHRPEVADNIPQCNLCHSGNAHFELEGCKSCHNPHQPLEIVLKGDLRKPCLTCHTSQQEEMDISPSYHAKVSCNYCHADRHGVIPECLQCHGPHSDQMTQADCATCHQAHQPLTLTYGPQTGSVLCAACHQTAYNQLAATSTKHREVACVACHQDKHKNVPLCSDCHGMPHAPAIHQRFPKCNDCHNTAHDLNNWAQAAPAQKKK